MAFAEVVVDVGVDVVVVVDARIDFSGKRPVHAHVHDDVHVHDASSIR
jgi:DNA primase catalytic subunit